VGVKEVLATVQGKMMVVIVASAVIDGTVPGFLSAMGKGSAAQWASLAMKLAMVGSGVTAVIYTWKQIWTMLGA
jgi:hypothetical protein